MKERRQSFNKWYWKTRELHAKRKKEKKKKKRIQTDLISFTKLAKNEPYT